jgi:hypothetical protein
VRRTVDFLIYQLLVMLGFELCPIARISRVREVPVTPVGRRPEMAEVHLRKTGVGTPNHLIR